MPIRDKAPRKENGHRKARKLYPILGICENEGCDQPATDRHHVNGNTFDNRRENVMFLCRRCHMAIDGRLSEFESHSRSKQGIQLPKPCKNCQRLTKKLRQGRCHACSEYFCRRGIERPYKVDGRKEKAESAQSFPCKRCGRSANIVGRPIRGFCKSCYRTLQRNGFVPIQLSLPGME